jgi:hypothetical protein
MSACGSGPAHGHTAARVAKQDSSAGAPARQYVRQDFGDYDEDEYRRINPKTEPSDGDNDDLWDGDALDPHGKPDGDNDHDNSSGTYFDSDDTPLREGRPATQAERAQIAELLKRYYRLAARGEGEPACSIVQSSVAASIAETLGRPPGPSYYRGDTCAAVLSKVFGVNHTQLAAYDASLRVAAVRVKGVQATVVMAFAGHAGRQTRLVHERGKWRFATILDEELP